MWFTCYLSEEMFLYLASSAWSVCVDVCERVWVSALSSVGKTATIELTNAEIDCRLSFFFQKCLKKWRVHSAALCYSIYIISSSSGIEMFVTTLSRQWWSNAKRSELVTGGLLDQTSWSAGLIWVEKVRGTACPTCIPPLRALEQGM